MPRQRSRRDELEEEQRRAILEQDNVLSSARMKAVIPKCNYTAIIPPAATNDLSQGYTPGSIWVDITGDKAYICVHAAVGAALWRETSAIGAPGSGSMSTVKEATVQLGGADIVTLDFGAGFDLTENPDTEINIALDLSEIAAGGELAGTMDAPTVDDTHSGSAHHNAVTLGDTQHSLATQVLSGVAAGAAQAGHVTTAAQIFSGVKTFADGILTDTVGEETATAGVTIDPSAGTGQGTWIKDNKIYPKKDITAVYIWVDANQDLFIQADTDDYIHYDKDTNTWRFVIGGSAQFELTTAGMTLNNQELQSIAEPTQATSAATKNYADTKVAKSLYDAYSILMATTDNTPIALTVDAQTLVGRITGGAIAALTIAQVKTLLGAGAASGLATLDASSKVVENPATAQTSAGVGKIPISGSDNQIDEGWIGNINIDSTPTSDHTVTGIKTELTAGASLVFGDYCYVGTDGKMEKAIATAETTARVIAVCVDTIAEDAAGTFLLHGFIRDDTYNFTTIGAKIYLSDDTAGALDLTAPTTTNYTTNILGIALTADVLYFNPQLVVVEHV